MKFYTVIGSLDGLVLSWRKANVTLRHASFVFHEINDKSELLYDITSAMFAVIKNN